MLTLKWGSPEELAFSLGASSNSSDNAAGGALEVESNNWGSSDSSDNVAGGAFEVESGVSGYSSVLGSTLGG